MTTLEKSDMYDLICSTLTNYENPQDAGLTELEAAAEMYVLLVDIRNHWEELINTEE